MDLATTDAAAAKSFYSDVFGWDLEDSDAGGVVYTMCRVDGDAVCGLYEISDDARRAGAPPNWTSYVTVSDADAAAGRAKDLGGGVISDAFDVLDVGRMAVLEDRRAPSSRSGSRARGSALSASTTSAVCA